MIVIVIIPVMWTDPNGKILSPVSDYSKSIFGKDIAGEHALKLLFFHLKDDSLEKKKLVNAFKKSWKSGIYGKYHRILHQGVENVNSLLEVFFVVFE